MLKFLKITCDGCSSIFACWQQTCKDELKSLTLSAAETACKKTHTHLTVLGVAGVVSCWTDCSQYSLICIYCSIHIYIQTACGHCHIIMPQRWHEEVQNWCLLQVRVLLHIKRLFPQHHCSALPHRSVWKGAMLNTCSALYTHIDNTVSTRHHSAERARERTGHEEKSQEQRRRKRKSLCDCFTSE